MNDIKILISSVLIIASFFIGYLFADKSSSHKLEEALHEKIRVNVQVKSKTITIDSDNKNVVLLLNGEETSSGSIILE